MLQACTFSMVLVEALVALHLSRARNPTTNRLFDFATTGFPGPIEEKQTLSWFGAM